MVALREWSTLWKDRRVTLSVRSDNVSTLSLVCKMQPHSEQLGIIARELALEVCESAVSPDDAVHIPGIANVAADALSRVHQPGYDTPLPEYLRPELKWECAHRSPRWWRSVPHR